MESGSSSATAEHLILSERMLRPITLLKDAEWQEAALSEIAPQLTVAN